MNPYSSPHAVLSNIYLLSEIFGYLYPERPSLRRSERGQHDPILFHPLANLASVCKTFYDPALDVLWERQDNMSPTLSLLPQLAPGYSISNAHLARFETYTKRVRHFSLEYPHGPSGLNILLRLHKGRPLFPSLRRLIVYNWPITPTESALLFCSTLQDVLLQRAESRFRHDHFGPCSPLALRQQNEMCLRSLGTRSPDLRRFTFEISVLTHISMLDSILAALHTVRTAISIELELDQFSPDRRWIWLQKLSGMENLHSLHLHIQQFFKHDMAHLLPNAFPSLRTLRVAGQSQAWSQFFSHISSPSLKDISLSDTQSWLTKEDHYFLHQWVDTLARHRALEGVSIHNLYETSTHISTHKGLSLWTIVEPLLQLHQLKRLVIDSGQDVTVTLSDDKVIRMATAWPGLQSLHLPQDTWSFPCPTVGSLIELASHCPQLRALSLGVDFTNLPDVHAVAHMRHRLDHLACPPYNQMDVRAERKVAGILDHVFPFLTKIYPPFKVLSRDVDKARMNANLKLVD
ncbi:unnamed protein product [Somion occarium]|uniref:F-box domain-containing protein n=1 Tax=Somion occarium TaxID=3059160 RepID=A0ABP1DS34_9APHY